MQQVHISTFVGISAFCFGAAVWRHLDPGVPPPRADVSRIPPWIFIVVNGFLALVAPSALIGIWFGRSPPSAETSDETMVLDEGNVKELEAASLPSRDLVPVTEANRQGISDPLTAML
jgi:hypothetical protein